MARRAVFDYNAFQEFKMFGMKTSDLDHEVMAAFLAANPGRVHPSKREVEEFLSRETDAILARLDRAIPELRRRTDNLLERLSR